MSAAWCAIDLVFRQVHPKHWDGTHPNSQAFFPTPEHKEKLSVDDSRLVTAEESHSHFAKVLHLNTVGTWALSFEEIEAAGDLVLRSDPVLNQQEPAKNNPAYCVIDFARVSSKGQKKKRAQTLAIKASARGCRYRPPA